MSITPHDVPHLIDQNPEQPHLRQQEISRIVRVLNAHRHPTIPSTGRWTLGYRPEPGAPTRQ